MAHSCPDRPLGELLTFKRGISWDSSQERSQQQPGTLPVLRIPNVRERLNLDELIFIKAPPSAIAREYSAKAGTILLVGSNGNPDRVGNAVFIPESTDYLFASFLIGAQVQPEADADAKFLFHLISSPKIQDQLTRSVQGSTGLKKALRESWWVE